jgi:uncharacterized membrane protein
MRMIWLVAVLSLGAAPAQAKSFYYPSITVDAEVRPDGSMHVSEARTFAFSGNFHEAWHKIPLPPGTRLENVAVAQNGQPYRLETSQQTGTFWIAQRGAETEVHWHYDITDQTVTFTVDYDVVGAAEKHADYAVLYWQFIEPDRSVRADQTQVTLALPGGVPKAAIKAFAHGPLWGKIEVGDSRVVFTCNPLPANEMLEGRILFPTEFLISSPHWDSVEVLPAVQQQEKAWVDEANRQRIKAQASVFLPLVLCAAGIAAWLGLYLAYGREHQEANAPEYVREPLEGWTPNEAAYLWRQGSLGPQDMTATVMDLVRRGALRLTVKREEHELLGGLLGTISGDEQYLERLQRFAGEMSPSERYLVEEVLFRGHGSPGEQVSMSEIRAEAKENPTSARARYEHWRSLATRESERMPLHDPRSKVAMGFGMALGALMFFSVFLLGPLLNSPTAMAPAFVGFALIPGSLAIRRRTREAAAALHRWQAFRRYLTDFSQLEQYPAPAVALWEHYLVFAITLGVAERVIEQFRGLHQLMVKQGEAPSVVFPNWVSHGGSPFTSMDSIGSALSSFSSNFATATSSFSSSSGGGGGFSGGGGGGGGGGSSGAR